MSQFEEEYPSIESYWRAIVLFGQNVASYKFALAKSLLDLVDSETTRITLEDLAIPFAKHITEHLKLCDKQGTSGSSKFLDAARKFNLDELTGVDLKAATVSLGFNNVIDAFHVVNRGEIPIRFFDKDFKRGDRGIVITDDLLALKESAQLGNLPYEAEARWRLVETAWALGINRNVIQITIDPRDDKFNTLISTDRRVSVTSTRDALNGYQKGSCFYCSCGITLESRDANLAEVDHYFPWALRQMGHLSSKLNGIWNLVLSCKACNREKSARIPEIKYLDRLRKRNDFLIESHHPLRETLIQQTGNTASTRHAFLQDMDNEAIHSLVHRWHPDDEHPPTF